MGSRDALNRLVKVTRHRPSITKMISFSNVKQFVLCLGVLKQPRWLVSELYADFIPNLVQKGPAFKIKSAFLAAGLGSESLHLIPLQARSPLSSYKMH